MRRLNTRQDYPLPCLHPHYRHTSHRGDQIHRNHSICCARSHASTLHVRPHRSGWRLVGPHARYYAHRMRLQASAVSRPWLHLRRARRDGLEHLDEGDDDAARFIFPCVPPVSPLMLLYFVFLLCLAFLFVRSSCPRFVM